MSRFVFCLVLASLVGCSSQDQQEKSWKPAEGTPAAGDIVMLKAGGVKWTVESIKDDTAYVVRQEVQSVGWHNVEYFFRREKFNLIALYKMEYR